MKLLILKGLPGSGKTTWAKKYVEENVDWIRINRDDLRNMRGKYWIPKQEKLITKFENDLIIESLMNGYNVILDATNLNDDRNKSRIEKLKKMFNGNWDDEINVSTKFFDMPVLNCIENDKKRNNPVGEKVILKMYEKYFDKNVYVENPELPHCVIFDIDGTLSAGSDRSPYDYSKVMNDKVNIPVFRLYQMVRNFKDPYCEIIIFTGRDDDCEMETKKWLSDNEIHYSQLHMRKTGDKRKDAIVKKEMFDEFIRDKYYCEFTVDDRNQMIDMYRLEIGLACFQVDYGDF